MPTFRNLKVLALLATVAGGLGCGGKTMLEAGKSVPGSADAGPDVGIDAGSDAGHEAGPLPSDPNALDERWQQVPNIDDALSVSVGEDGHSCALRKTGEVACWGKGAYGQLGDGTLNDAVEPVTVLDLYDAVGVAVGLYFSCALRATGEVVCWGRGGEGQLGNGRPTEAEVGSVVVDTTAPVLVFGVSDAVQLSAAQWSEGACALRATGDVVCWGGGEYAGPWRSVATSAERAFPEVRASGVAAISVGVDQLCMIRNDGQVLCGDPGSDEPVPALQGAVAISAGLANPCAVLHDGDVTCQQGFGDSTAPVSLPERDAVAVAAGRWSSCALRANGRVSCWGKRLFGLVGTTDNLTELPTPVIDLKDAVAISLKVSSYNELCAVRANGTIVCWNDPE